MFKGPAPTPTPILEARGSKRAAGRKSAPRPPAKLPACPDWLKGDGCNLWERLVKELAEMKVLAQIDQTLLAVLCQTFADWRYYSDKARTGGDVVNGALGNPVISPWVRIRDAAAERLVKLCDRFGLSPAARARLVMNPNEQEADPFEDFLRGKPN